MVDIHELEKFPTALIEKSPRILFTMMILEGKDSKELIRYVSRNFLILSAVEALLNTFLLKSR